MNARGKKYLQNMLEQRKHAGGSRIYSLCQPNVVFTEKQMKHSGFLFLTIMKLH